jgi:hypothetical protein
VNGTADVSEDGRQAAAYAATPRLGNGSGLPTFVGGPFSMPKCCAETRKTCTVKLTTRQRQSQVAAAIWMHCTKQMLAKQV